MQNFPNQTNKQGWGGEGFAIVSGFFCTHARQKSLASCCFFWLEEGGGDSFLKRISDQRIPFFLLPPSGTQAPSRSLHRGRLPLRSPHSSKARAEKRSRKRERKEAECPPSPPSSGPMQASLALSRLSAPFRNLNPIHKAGGRARRWRWRGVDGPDQAGTEGEPARTTRQLCKPGRRTEGQRQERKRQHPTQMPARTGLTWPKASQVPSLCV